MHIFSRKYIFRWSIFHCYASLPECNSTYRGYITPVTSLFSAIIGATFHSIYNDRLGARVIASISPELLKARAKKMKDTTNIKGLQTATIAIAGRGLLFLHMVMLLSKEFCNACSEQCRIVLRRLKVTSSANTADPSRIHVPDSDV